MVAEFKEYDDPIGDFSTVGEFWQWAMSDMLGNANRGLLAEFLVGTIIGADMDKPRTEWDCHDLVYKGYKLEIKSSAYIQTWHKKNEKRSVPIFGIAPHTCDEATSQLNQTNEVKRWADVYVFCLFPSAPEVNTRDVLAVNEWRFYVTSTSNLESCIPYEQKSARISTIHKICGDPVTHDQLKQHIDAALGIEEKR